MISIFLSKPDYIKPKLFCNKRKGLKSANCSTFKSLHLFCLLLNGLWILIFRSADKFVPAPSSMFDKKASRNIAQMVPALLTLNGTPKLF